MSQPRMPGRNFLFVPGPTNVPDRVMRAMMVAMEDHRSSKFPELTLWLFQEMKKVFKTENGQVFIFPSSGTGAWEAAMSNTLSRGDNVLVPRLNVSRKRCERTALIASRRCWWFITRLQPASLATSLQCDARSMLPAIRQCCM